MNRPPAEVGVPLEQVDTPALLVDLDAFERNLERMAAAVSGAGIRFRPHAKTHKCAEIARRQMALGAVGVCCQKVSEAEALVNGGVGDVLVSNEVVGAAKLSRLAELTRKAQTAVCVDHPENVDALGRAMRDAGTQIDVLVEIDVGARRCGVAPGEPAVTLARRVAADESLRFRGLQAYQGSAQHIRDYSERQQMIRRAAEDARRTAALLADAGVECETVTGAGTGTFHFEATSGVYNELQAGSYVFMDADYARNLDDSGAAVAEFEHSLFVYTTVMSAPEPGRVVVDAGLKALSMDSGMPSVCDLPKAAYRGPSDEHGNLDLAGAGAALKLGDKVRLVPGHCDPTVNLHDWYVCVRNGRVEALWPIDARGAIF